MKIYTKAYLQIKDMTIAGSEFCEGNLWIGNNQTGFVLIGADGVLEENMDFKIMFERFFKKREEYFIEIPPMIIDRWFKLPEKPVS